MASKRSIWLLLALGATLGGMSYAHDNDMPTGQTTATDDPYLWLEDIHGARAMDWVKAQNAVTEKQFASSP
ncbi:hypothetical protein ACXWTZ_09090, partial [Streptococcus pyogenes]